MTTSRYVCATRRSKYLIRISESEGSSRTIGHATGTNSTIARVCRMAGSGTSEKLFLGRPGGSQLMGGGESCIPGPGAPLSSTCAVDDRARHRRARYRRVRFRRARHRRARHRRARYCRARYRRARHRRARDRCAPYIRARHRRSRAHYVVPALWTARWL